MAANKPKLFRKRHYEALAQAITRHLRQDVPHSTYAWQQFRGMLDELLIVFLGDNCQFREETFVKACGLEWCENCCDFWRMKPPGSLLTEGQEQTCPDCHGVAPEGAMHD